VIQASIFEKIKNKTKPYSHQETGIKITYERDKTFKRYCKTTFINIGENINNGIF
jgi:deoxyribodipyrimidine photo-lyase